MVPNARLTSFKNQTGQTGGGQPVFGIERLASPVPVQLVNPSSHKIDAAQRRGIRFDTLLIAPARAFEVAGQRPKAGDRMLVMPEGVLQTERAGDVMDARDFGDGFVEIMLATRVGGGA